MKKIERLHKMVLSAGEFHIKNLNDYIHVHDMI